MQATSYPNGDFFLSPARYRTTKGTGRFGSASWSPQKQVLKDKLLLRITIVVPNRMEIPVRCRGHLIHDLGLKCSLR